MHHLLTIALLCFVIGFSLLVGIGIGSDVRRLAQRSKQTRQRFAERLGFH